MSPDHWTVFTAVLLPYVPYLITMVYKRQRGLYDPANPRDSNAQLEGWALRAKGAEANSWEALTAYVAVSWLAHEAGGDPDQLLALGVGWVVVRLAYIVAYVVGAGMLRGGLWALSVVLLLARLGVSVA